MRSDLFVTIVVGLLLSCVFAFCMSSASGEADKEDEKHYNQNYYNREDKKDNGKN